VSPSTLEGILLDYFEDNGIQHLEASLERHPDGSFSLDCKVRRLVSEPLIKPA
jgi:hypothetical protein